MITSKIAVLSGVLACLGSGLAAADEAPSPEADLNSKAMRACRDDTAEYQIRLGRTTDDRTAGSLLTPVEVLKWVNPVREDQLGVVHCWIRDGRVEVVSSVFSARQQPGTITFTHEMASVSTEPLSATSKDTVHWQSLRPGATFQRFPEAAVPAGTRGGRLIQLRNLARQFSAHSISPYGDQSRWELRMLPQPLLRYEAGTDGQVNSQVLDGALFAFVSTAGTDPELLLPIEARNGADGWEWQFAAARFSDYSLSLHLQDMEVWRFVNSRASAFFEAGETDIYRLRQDRTISVSSLQ